MLDIFGCGEPARVVLRKAVYKSCGFQEPFSNPLRMFLPLGVVHVLLAEDASRDRGRSEACLRSMPRYLMVPFTAQLMQAFREE